MASKPLLYALGGVAYLLGVGAVYKYVKNRNETKEFEKIPAPTTTGSNHSSSSRLLPCTEPKKQSK